MPKICFSIRDEKVQSYGMPFCCATQAEAVRMVGDALTTDTIFARHPNDFTLYNVGSFDEISGQIVPVDSPIYVLKLSDLMEVNNASSEA